MSAQRRDVAWVAAAAVLLALALLPYWVYGSNSAIGWYDEFDGLIPWYHARMQAASDRDFMHSFAGGTGALYGFFAGNEHVSAYGMLLRAFGDWPAGLLFRFGGMLSLFLGAFIFARRNEAITAPLATALALFATLCTPYPYGWAIGGQGWDLSVVVWSFLLVGSHQAPKRRFLLHCLAWSCVATTVSGPVTLLPLLFFAVPLACLFFSGSGAQRKTAMRRGLVVLAAMTFASIINWQDSLSYSLLKAGSFSARLLGVAGDAAQPTMAETLTRGWHAIVVGFTRFANECVLYFFPLFLGLGLVWGRITESAGLMLITGLCPLLLQALSMLLPRWLPKYRWDSLDLEQAVLLTLWLAHIARKSRIPQVIPAVLLAALACLSGWRLATITLEQIERESGIGIMTAYAKTLAPLAQHRGQYRVATGGRVGMAPAYYDLDFFGGMLMNTPIRQAHFFFTGVLRGVGGGLATHRAFFRADSLQTEADLRLLELANVRFVLADKPLNTPLLTLRAQDPGLSSENASFWLGGWLNRLDRPRRLVYPLYVYELPAPWPRVFVASDVVSSESSYRTPEFYTQLLGLPYAAALVAAEDRMDALPTWGGSPPRALDSTLDARGASVASVKEGEVIVFNQVFVPQWRALCGEKPLPLVPVNGSMMATRADGPCEKLRFDYVP